MKLADLVGIYGDRLEKLNMEIRRMNGKKMSVLFKVCVCFSFFTPKNPVQNRQKLRFWLL